MAATAFDALSLSSQLLFTPEQATYDMAFRNSNRELRFIPGDPPIPCMVHASATTSTIFVVHFHGTAGDIERSGAWWKLCRDYPAADCNVVAVEFPGYGVFPGYPTERSVVEVGCAAVRYLHVVCHVPLENIVLSGRSMGGGVACAVAEVFPAVGGLIVGSTFTSLNSVVRLKSLALAWYMRTRFDSKRVMADSINPNCNVLVYHGAKDALIPQAQGEELYNSCRSSSKRFYSDPNGTHPAVEANEAIASFIVQHQRLCDQSRQAVETSRRVFASFLSPGDAHLAMTHAPGRNLRTWSHCAAVALSGAVVAWLVPTCRLEAMFTVLLLDLALAPAADNPRLRYAKYGAALLLCQVIFPLIAVSKAASGEGGSRQLWTAAAMTIAAHLVLR